MLLVPLGLGEGVGQRRCHTHEGNHIVCHWLHGYVVNSPPVPQLARSKFAHQLTICLGLVAYTHPHGVHRCSGATGDGLWIKNQVATADFQSQIIRLQHLLTIIMALLKLCFIICLAMTCNIGAKKNGHSALWDVCTSICDHSHTLSHGSGSCTAKSCQIHHVHSEQWTGDNHSALRPRRAGAAHKRPDVAALTKKFHRESHISHDTHLFCQCLVLSS